MVMVFSSLWHVLNDRVFIKLILKESVLSVDESLTTKQKERLNGYCVSAGLQLLHPCSSHQLGFYSWNH